MNDKVKTLEEAKKMVQARNHNTILYLKFCPLIKDKCNPECVCFEISRFAVRRIYGKDDEYTITIPRCDNAMFLETEIYFNG